MARTSTFAWFGASATASAVKKSDDIGDVVITKHVASIGGIEVPLTVTLESNLANADQLLYATYKDDAEAKNLQGGYITTGGTFQGVDDGDLDSVFGEYSTGVHYLLYSSLKVTIDIDFTTKRTAAGQASNPRWVDGNSDGDYMDDGDLYYFGTSPEVAYKASEIITSLQSAQVDVGLKQLVEDVYLKVPLQPMMQTMQVLL